MRCLVEKDLANILDNINRIFKYTINRILRKPYHLLKQGVVFLLEPNASQFSYWMVNSVLKKQEKINRKNNILYQMEEKMMSLCIMPHIC